MISNSPRLAALAVAATLLLAGSLAEAQDAVVARVNGKAITEADMQLAEAEVGADLGSIPPATRRRVLLEFLISQQLFAEAAEADKLGAGPVFDARIAYWRRRSLREAYFEKALQAGDVIAEAKAIYDKEVAGVKGEEEVHARHILVESEAKAKELYERIVKGADFAELARTFSKDPGSKQDGGSLGFFGRGQMVPQFEEAAFKLKAGEVSAPIQSQFGWHIIRVEERKALAPPPFEAVKDRLAAALVHRKAQELNQRMRAKAAVEIVDPAMQKEAQEKQKEQDAAKGAAPKIIIKPQGR